MDDDKRASGNIKTTFVNTRHGVIPPPATQRRFWKPGSSSVTQKRLTRLVILFLVVLVFFWTKSRSPSHATHVQDDSKYGALIREYMKHGNRRPNGPLRGIKAEELFL